MKAAEKGTILIVGAGPTGMVVAIELARRGVDFRIIDKRKGPSLTSRAFTLHARTMEMFEHMGIVHKFLEKGIKNKGFNFNFKGKSAQPTLEFSSLDSLYAYTLIYDQSQTDRHLREHLEMTYDVWPEWSTELIELTQDGESCYAVLKKEHPPFEETLRPTWVIGCDGVRSFVRAAADLDQAGSNYDGMIMEMMDTKLEGFKGADDRVHYYISKENFLLVTKLPDGNHRLGVSGKCANQPSDLSRQQRFQTLINEHLQNVAVQPPSLERKWEVWRRIADNYRRGNIFLAGDSAHVHSPSGGQGMNVSMQDAFNLGWKLAMVAKGQAQPALLDTYTKERIPVGEQVLAGTDAMHDIIMAHGQGMEDRLHLTQSDGWHDKTVERISGLSYNYCGSISLPSELNIENGVTPGSRAPDVKLPDGTSLFDRLRHPRITLLIITNNEHDLPSTQQFITELATLFDDDLFSISQMENCVDFSEIYGSYNQPHIYAIRPDGYVSCHCLLENTEILHQHLASIFRKRTKQSPRLVKKLFNFLG